MTAPTPNAELAYRVLDHIDAHPEQWDQTEWCGTAQCFAGWTVALSGERPVDEFAGIMPGGVHVSDRAAQLLGFEHQSAMDEHAAGPQIAKGHVDEFGDPIEPFEPFELFAASNERHLLGELVAEIFGPRPDGGEGGSRTGGEPS